MSTENKLQRLLRSRKFWAALIGLIVIVLKALLPDLAVSEEQLNNLVTLIAAFILGTGLDDGLTALRPNGPSA